MCLARYWFLRLSAEKEEPCVTQLVRTAPTTKRRENQRQQAETGQDHRAWFGNGRAGNAGNVRRKAALLAAARSGRGVILRLSQVQSEVIVTNGHKYVGRVRTVSIP